jgi:hypothetical protein
MRLVFLTAAVVLAFVAGAAAVYYFMRPMANRTTVSADVLLEQTRKTLKLSVVEGDFSEIYSNKNYQYFDFWPFRKQILMRVKARVLVGYDFEKWQFDIDSVNRTIRVRQNSKPEILSIDHTVDYYDISEGLFNSFSPGDYNRIQADTKDRIRQMVGKSNLFNQANEQLTQTLTQLEQLLQFAGWTLIVEQPQPDQQLIR